MFTAVLPKDGVNMEKKIVSISSKRQITIPQKYFTLLGFADEAECILKGNELIIRPAHSNSGGEFAVQILEELISLGYSGEELLKEFKSKQKNIRPAVERLIDEAEKAAKGDGEYFSYDDVFASED